MRVARTYSCCCPTLLYTGSRYSSQRTGSSHISGCIGQVAENVNDTCNGVKFRQKAPHGNTAETCADQQTRDNAWRMRYRYANMVQLISVLCSPATEWPVGLLVQRSLASI